MAGMLYYLCKILRFLSLYLSEAISFASIIKPRNFGTLPQFGEGTGMGLLRKGFTFTKGETFKKPHASAPEEPFLKYFGALHLLDSKGDHVSTNITGALHLASIPVKSSIYTRKKVSPFQKVKTLKSPPPAAAKCL